MSDWKFLNKHRARVPSRYVPEMYLSDETYGFNGLFRFSLDGHSVRCIASDGEGWQHVSVTMEFERKTPRWELMCKIKDLFWEPADAVIQIHPPRSEYVNNHEFCLHLWRCTDGREQPLPPSILVGFKGNVKLAPSVSANGLSHRPHYTVGQGRLGQHRKSVHLVRCLQREETRP